ncbi:unnamed protein product [Cuscuta campestris]|uniref:CASP-like protein n=2 Tax=Cuscuta sect. Cleistogrammica TaxID=1824901 RepID=A0A484L3C5_9ASTE|nr:hypothetical protein DM860_001775 [Cuscuta australis]VFQ70798.1 unnamed protein product [Cuscuta campestris]
MTTSRSAVHPVEPPPVSNFPTRVRMNNFQGMPGTAGSLFLRLSQLAFAVISLCVMATTSDFLSATAFCFLVAAVSLQSLWSLSLLIADVYALLVKRSFRNNRFLRLFTIGDGVTSTLTFAAACASAGITVLIGNDIDKCAVNHCKRFMSATAMTFFCWFSSFPSYFFNLWSFFHQRCR